MRIGDLAKTTGVPVATLKFYLREGLLPAGTPTAVNQAEYDDVHVRRVKLVRALLHLGGLSIADAQRVLAAVDDETMPIHDALGVAQDAMVPKLDRSGTRYADALAEVDRFVRRHQLRVRPGAAVRGMLADAVVGLAECDLLGEPVTDTCELFDAMVPAMVEQAEREVATTPTLRCVRNRWSTRWWARWCSRWPMPRCAGWRWSTPAPSGGARRDRQAQ